MLSLEITVPDVIVVGDDDVSANMEIILLLYVCAVCSVHILYYIVDFYVCMHCMTIVVIASRSAWLFVLSWKYAKIDYTLNRLIVLMMLYFPFPYLYNCCYSLGCGTLIQ